MAMTSPAGFVGRPCLLLENGTTAIALGVDLAIFSLGAPLACTGLRLVPRKTESKIRKVTGSLIGSVGAAVARRGKQRMRANQRSKTAEWVAVARAAHLLYDRPVLLEDKFALNLLSRPWRWIVKTPPLFWLASRYTGMRTARGRLVIRARYTEEKLESAITAGIDQYVILGAGLDSFAWRRRDVAGQLTVFEIDHPDSQAAKRRRLQERGIAEPDNLEFISADLGRETVAAALARSHYRPDSRGFFSLLGIAQYLPQEALATTLRSIACVAAPGSELVLSYVQPRHLVDPAHLADYDRGVRWSARQGEPFVSLYDPDKFPQEVCAFGYELLENLLPREQALRYLSGRTDSLQPSALVLAPMAHFRVLGRHKGSR
jgi:methyltransferase (TIGR00027 family)